MTVDGNYDHTKDTKIAGAATSQNIPLKVPDAPLLLVVKLEIVPVVAVIEFWLSVPVTLRKLVNEALDSETTVVDAALEVIGPVERVVE